MALHKDLTGLDLHEAKLHANTHAPAGTDPLALAESQVTDLTADLAAKVVGPVSAVVNHVAIFADASGKVLQDGGSGTLPDVIDLGTFA